MLLHSKITGQGQPFLILHGLFGSSDNWYSFSKNFSDKFEVHLIDLRNHGRSFHSKNMNNKSMAKDLLFYIKHYDLKNIILMGHSLGGKVAMKFSIKNYKYLDKLISVDIGPKNYSIEHNNIINVLHDLDMSIFSSRKEVFQFLNNIYKDESLSRFLVKSIRIEKEDVSFRFNVDSIKNNIAFFGEKLDSEEICNTNSFFIKAEKSDYIIKKDFQVILNHFPNSNIIKVKDASHWVHVSNPSGFVNTIKEIINY